MKPKWLGVLLLVTITGVTIWNEFFLPGRQHFSFNIRTFLSQINSTNFSEKPRDNLVLLYQIQSSLQNSFANHLPPDVDVFNLLDDIIHNLENDKIGHNNTEIQTSSEEDDVLLDVCPEDWYQTKDMPFYQKGFFIISCSNVRSIADILSIIVQFENFEECKENFCDILIGLNQSYSTIAIYISNTFRECCNVSLYKNVVLVSMEEKLTAGKVWNKLISLTNTPYVLIGRDLNYFDGYAQIERQIRMISYNEDIQIVGGSQRNKSGHWTVGCYQILLQNYILEYRNGYYVSRNECMFCDHILGSFVARKSVLSRLPFDESLPSSMLFEDFFLQLKNASVSVMNCPDAMYYSTNPYQQKRMDDKTTWFPLVQKWEINRIFIDRDVRHSFSCSESKISCKNSVEKTNAFLLPICCMEQFGEAVKFFHEFCVFQNISYEIMSGLVLGSIKIKDKLPWDNDGDILFYDSNYSIFEKHEDSFNKKQYVLDTLTPPGSGKHAFFFFRTPEMRIEMYGIDVLSKDLYLPRKFKDVPTRMKLQDTWVFTQVSPGFYARNCYGREILKHSNKWIHLGLDNEHETYKPGKFLDCPKTFHHACQNHFPADGSLQFYVP